MCSFFVVDFIYKINALVILNTDYEENDDTTWHPSSNSKQTSAVLFECTETSTCSHGFDMLTLLPVSQHSTAENWISI